MLHEIGKLTVRAKALVDELTPKLELMLADPPLAIICQAAADPSWTRDPFDRLISAHVLATATPLVTKDRTIREHLSLAWWP